ncbi:hypothetical protein O0I10_012225 [Lichtheimia ornata]|uniref:AB hydrolase-1 domain-containing protein n=1 Tax=Lichtheimia ornata TaxID=688661 RepID=A0AAD7URG2_9FUNG|nr:uncharacterized protein O0I10_012225 [Lichtheimia ornata]KAJ8652167.1 hypothetical protein O0I10_012225 [Lichtheimia ornata]
MAFTRKQLITIVIAGIFSALFFRTDPALKNTLPSLRVQPSDTYTLDFYPGGHFVELPQGTMRYWLFGNPDGERVVLVHGISSGAVTYDKLARHLADNGYYVLVFDLWGRGYSDAPPGYYDESLYTTQLVLLLQKVGWQRANVVGISLGGGIATSFTAFYPEIVNKLVLIAPAGLMDSEKDLPLYGKLLKLSMVRSLSQQSWFKWVAHKGVAHFFKTSRTKESRTSPDFNRLATAVFSQFQGHSGFFRAFLSTVMDYPLDDLHDRYQKIGQQNPNLPVLVIWGDEDKTVPFRHAPRLQQYIPQSQLLRFDGAGHDVLITRYEAVDQAISEFLRDSK